MSQTTISWEDVLIVAAKLMLKYCNGSPFQTNSENSLHIHVRPKSGGLLA